jgi:hypothetical protein
MNKNGGIALFDTKAGIAQEVAGAKIDGLRLEDIEKLSFAGGKHE